MPKIIKDIKQTIMNSAINQFLLVGYDKVSMRSVAKDASIAVGTLYNHFPNKDNLFAVALHNHWQTTLEGLKIQILKKDDPIEKIEFFITARYDSMVSLKGLGRELFFKGLFDNKSNPLHMVVKEASEVLTDLMLDYYSVYNINDLMLHRKVETILIAMGHLVAKYPDEKENNIKYLIGLI